MKLSHYQNLGSQHDQRNLTNPTNPSKRKGFSLVEVIIAIGIVALLLTGFLGVFGSAQKSINRSLGVKEANMLKDALETEMSTYRSTEVGTYDNSFHKAFDMIKNSNSQAEAILVYQYKAEPEDNDDDGILPPFTGSDGIQGSSYLTQIAVRKNGQDDAIMTDEITNTTVVGNVYAVRMTQLITNISSGDLELSTNNGEIWHDVGGTNEEAVDHEAYSKAVITFQAEFFRIPSNSYGYIKNGSWSFSSLGNPVAVINMAVRR